ncbi:MAG: DUF427 domain-containing protein [Chloroflexi bacterium]|nr:DUF427 domain-containing protein [Chloroflexota bacterium]
MKAILNGAIVAESDKTVVVEGNHYFPPDSIKAEHFSETESHTVCHWKGIASYYDVQADGVVKHDAAWTYHEPSKLAEGIKDYVAFYKHLVEVRK